MYFIWGGGGLAGRGALPADNTPGQRKTPLNPPPNPPLFKFGSGGVLSMISNFRESPPPWSRSCWSFQNLTLWPAANRYSMVWYGMEKHSRGHIPWT